MINCKDNHFIRRLYNVTHDPVHPMTTTVGKGRMEDGFIYYICTHSDYMLPDNWSYS